MVVGVLELRLLVRESQSLKDKRRVVKSLKDRIAHRFAVSIAEVDSLDDRQQAELGAAFVSNDRRHAEEVLSKVVEFVRRSVTAELIDFSIETY
ncbi:MAG TPA: DUF503 domain-containing protein [Phycisphaerae bacterium]|nr:DUF503 domain-containing protein [Phycisphaerae bacterium]HOI54487.1 DUF503 domain-containing protein [Phycisphaerae bacterium]